MKDKARLYRNKRGRWIAEYLDKIYTFHKFLSEEKVLDILDGYGILVERETDRDGE